MGIINIMATNNLRKVLGKAKKMSWATRGYAEDAATARANNELTTKWLNRLRATANTNVSRDQHSQLQSILDYYNRQNTGAEELPAIDWRSYEKAIHTPGVVGKIQAKYDEFFATEFHVDGAVSRCGARSELMKKLDVSMTYN